MNIICQVLTNVLGKSLVFSFTKWLTNKFFVEKPRKLVAFGTVYQSQLPTLSGKLHSLKTFVLRVSLTDPYNYWILSWYATPEFKPFSMVLYSLHLHLDCWVNCLSHNNSFTTGSCITMFQPLHCWSSSGDGVDWLPAGVGGTMVDDDWCI